MEQLSFSEDEQEELVNSSNDDDGNDDDGDIDEEGKAFNTKGKIGHDMDQNDKDSSKNKDAYDDDDDDNGDDDDDDDDDDDEGEEEEDKFKDDDNDDDHAMNNNNDDVDDDNNEDNTQNITSHKYVPPHLRRQLSSEAQREHLNRIRRQVKGLLNR